MCKLLELCSYELDGRYLSGLHHSSLLSFTDEVAYTDGTCHVSHIVTVVTVILNLPLYFLKFNLYCIKGALALFVLVSFLATSAR